jgi:hypothetical protein
LEKLHGTLFYFGFHTVKTKKQEREAFLPRQGCRGAKAVMGTAAGNSSAPEKPKECI